MDRRNFLESLGLGFIPGLDVDDKYRTEILLRDMGNETYTFIVTDDPKLLKTQVKHPVCVLNIKTFEAVVDHVKQNKDEIERLLTTGPKPGTKYYWEDNHHDKIVATLKAKHPALDKKHDLSNALFALQM